MQAAEERVNSLQTRAMAYWGTLPKTNIAPENRQSQQEIPSSNHPFSSAMLVSGRVNGVWDGRVFSASLSCKLKLYGAPRKFNSSPLKMMVGRRSSPFGMVNFQGTSWGGYAFFHFLAPRFVDNIFQLHYIGSSEMACRISQLQKSSLLGFSIVSSSSIVYFCDVLTPARK